MAKTSLPSSSKEFLKSRPGNRTLFYLLVGLICQTLFWYYAIPGPQILESVSAEDRLEQGIQACWMSGIFLLVIPMLAMIVVGDDPRRLGLGLKNFKYGCQAVVIVTPIFLISTVLGSGDPDLIKYYPIPGPVVGQTVLTFLVWTACYACFYVSFEFFYRGFLLFAPDDIDLFQCFLIQMFCCVLIHVGKPAVETLAAIPASILFAWLAIRTRSLWFGFVIHYLVGITNDLAALFHQGEFFVDKN